MNPGETTRVRSPAGTWKPAECPREVAPRLYEVLIDGQVRRWNRKDILRTREHQTARDFDECESVAQPDAVIPAPFVSPPTSPTEVEPTTPSPVAESSTPCSVTESTVPSSEAEDIVVPSRRSTRQRRLPKRYKNFVMLWMIHKLKYFESFVYFWRLRLVTVKDWRREMSVTWWQYYYFSLFIISLWTGSAVEKKHENKRASEASRA